MKPSLLLLLPLLAACADRLTAPPAAAAPATAAAPQILMTSSCPAAVWDFTVDGAFRGVWLLPPGARLPLPVDSLRPVHALEATRWSPAPATVYRDSVRTGDRYPVPCP